jgi:hypothetical protein
MGKVKLEKISSVEIKWLVFKAISSHINGAYYESEPTRDKPYGVESNDWAYRFNQWPIQGCYKKEFRRFRHYRSRKSRDRALIDLKGSHPYLSFRVPQNEEIVLERLGVLPKRACPPLQRSFWKRIFGGDL